MSKLDKESKLLALLKEGLRGAQERLEKQRKLDIEQYAKQRLYELRITEERIAWPHPWPYPYSEHLIEALMGYCWRQLEYIAEKGRMHITFGFSYRFVHDRCSSCNGVGNTFEIRWDEEMKQYVMDYFNALQHTRVSLNAQDDTMLDFTLVE